MLTRVQHQRAPQNVKIPSMNPKHNVYRFGNVLRLLCLCDVHVVTVLPIRVLSVSARPFHWLGAAASARGCESVA